MRSIIVVPWWTAFPTLLQLTQLSARGRKNYTMQFVEKAWRPCLIGLFWNSAITKETNRFCGAKSSAGPPGRRILPNYKRTPPFPTRGGDQDFLVHCKKIPPAGKGRGEKKTNRQSTAAPAGGSDQGPLTPSERHLGDGGPWVCFWFAEWRKGQFSNYLGGGPGRHSDKTARPDRGVPVRLTQKRRGSDNSNPVGSHRLARPKSLGWHEAWAWAGKRF